MTRAEREEMRRDGESAARRSEFAAAAAAVRAFDQRRPMTIDAALAWCRAVRDLFGDAPTDRTPWRGGEYRL